MRRHEINDDDARRMLAGHIRNHLGGTGVHFSPWYELELCVQGGQLWRVSPQGLISLASVEALFTMTDEQIERAVFGVQR